MISALLIPLVTVAAVRAANDWSVPCNTGSCEWDTVGDAKSALASIKVNAPTRLLSDITPANGWEIMDCPEDWDKGARDVRLVCTSENPDEDCNTLLEDGAVDTVVRLPAKCGKGPFARVTFWGVSEDQTVTPAVKRSLQKRSLKLGKRAAEGEREVMQATLDWKLSEVSPKRGTLTFAVDASNRKIQKDDKVVVRSLLGKPVDKRFLGDLIDNVKEGVGEAVDKVGEGLDQAGEAIGEAAENVGEKIDEAADKVEEGVGEAIDKAKEIGQDVIDKVKDVGVNDVSDGSIEFRKSFTVFNAAVSCAVGRNFFDLDATVSVDADVKMNIGFAYVIRGSVIPPSLDDFAIAGVMSGRAKTTTNIDAFIAGTLDTGLISLLKLPLSPLTILGVVTIGPLASINVRGLLDMSNTMALSIPNEYVWEEVDFVFPPDKGEAKSDVAPKEDQAVSVAVGPTSNDQSITGLVEAHIVPRVEFGLDIFNGAISATVFLGMDGSLKGNVQADKFPEEESFSGCGDIKTAFEINVGLQGAILPFFAQAFTQPLFKVEKELFKKCFGNVGDGPVELPAEGELLDNGDGTFTDSTGAIVDETGAPIDGAAPELPPEGELFDNGDGTFTDSTGAIVDEFGTPVDGAAAAPELPPAGELFDNGDGTFTDSTGAIVDEFGDPVDGAASTELPPAGELFDNGDGTFTDSTGTIVDEFGDPVSDAAASAELPPAGELFDNGDGTFTDSTGTIVDEFGDPVDGGNAASAELPPEGELFDNGDGTFTDSTGAIVDEFGDPVNADTASAELPPAGQLFDNGDGTFIDSTGAIVDEFGDPVAAAKKRSLPIAQRKRSLPVAQRKRNLPIAQKKRSLPVAQRKRSLPVAQKKRGVSVFRKRQEEEKAPVAEGEAPADDGFQPKLSKEEVAARAQKKVEDATGKPFSRKVKRTPFGYDPPRDGIQARSLIGKRNLFCSPFITPGTGLLPLTPFTGAVPAFPPVV